MSVCPMPEKCGKPGTRKSIKHKSNVVPGCVCLVAHDTIDDQIKSHDNVVQCALCYAPLCTSNKTKDERRSNFDTQVWIRNRQCVPMNVMDMFDTLYGFHKYTFANICNYHYHEGKSVNKNHKDLFFF